MMDESQRYAYICRRSSAGNPKKAARGLSGVLKIEAGCCSGGSMATFVFVSCFLALLLVVSATVFLFLALLLVVSVVVDFLFLTFRLVVTVVAASTLRGTSDGVEIVLLDIRVDLRFRMSAMVENQ
jgi:hypothetical protein